MTRRVRVRIDRIVVQDGAIRDPAAFQAEVERQVALSLGAPGRVDGLAGRNQASVDAGRVKSAGDAISVAGAVTAAIGGGKR